MMGNRARRATAQAKATVPAEAPLAAGAPATIDDYIAGFALPVQALLQQVRATVRRAAPQAEEVISYRIPALRQQGVLVYFAAFKGHIGFYPPVQGDEALEREAAPWAGEKGNLRFPFDQPIPWDLIERITAHRSRQDLAASAGRKRAPRVAGGGRAGAPRGKA
jgi:uncharacterized protein YdhG (YjbR/CyaY superfamily)